MEFNEVVNNRRSIRDFDLNKVVTDETIEKIVKSAQRTPSWTNSQPWKVYVATGDTLTKIKAEHLKRTQSGMGGASELAVSHRRDWGNSLTVNTNHWSSAISNHLGAKQLAEFSNLQMNLFNAPALVYITIEREVSPWMVYDVGAFSQSFLLAAANEQIDTIPAYEIVKYPDDIRKKMAIPDNEMIIAGIAMGYRTDALINQFNTDRSSLTNVLKIKH